MSDGIRRRDFLKILAATGMAASCDMPQQPPENLFSPVVPPEGHIPGVAVWYATVCRECPAGCGVVVRVREGRALKAEGNPFHPINRGRLCAKGQASLQGLYNPDRIRQPLLRDASGRLQPVSWEKATQVLVQKIITLQKEGKTAGVTFLTGHAPGSFDRLIDLWMKALGADRHLVYETFSHESLQEANHLSFGRSEVPVYAIEEARYLLSFGADFLETWLSPVGYARAFGEMHRYRDGAAPRFVQVEPRLSLTGANADEWIPIKPGAEMTLALGMTREVLSVRSASIPAEELEALRSLLESYDLETVSRRTEVSAELVRQLAREFAQASPSLALGGGAAFQSRRSTAALVAINLLNYVAGNVGKTVRFGPVENVGKIGSYQAMRSLLGEMERGEVPLLLIHGTNPAFTLPPSAGFKAALGRVPFVVSFAAFLDETAEQAHLVLPDHTDFESWGDFIPRRGVHGLIQPVMRPLLDTRGTGDVLLEVARQAGPWLASSLPWPSFYDFLREGWSEIHRRLAPGQEFEAFWEGALRRGGVWEDIPEEPVRLSMEVHRIAFEEPTFAGPLENSRILVVYPSPLLFDGRGANKPWLQEVSDPITKVVWDSWVEIHPQTAAKLGVVQGDVVRVTSPYGRIEAPAYLYPGVRPDVVAIPLGQGHEAYGRYARNVGVNPLALLPPEAEEPSGGFPWLAVRVELVRTGRKSPLVVLQGGDRQDRRGIAQGISLAELKSSSANATTHSPPLPDIYAPHPHPEHRWGMVIDLQACIGCEACTVACYAENNVPVVGKKLCGQGREMSWISVQRYYGEDESGFPDIRFLPMLCQQCDNAPCEPVCPVYATYHNPEGLNVQVYNRCVGTRYCSNNCPYKVRRFNWFPYSWTAPLDIQLNPDVSVRSVGVMEKCTYCLQRIRDAKDRAKDEGRGVRDGEIVPACVQTCPTGALVFGDLKDPNSRVSELSQDPRGYHVLSGLNTHSSIAYLKKVIQL